MLTDLLAVFTPEERAELAKDVAHDFAGQSSLGFVVFLTGHRVTEASLAFVILLLIILATTWRAHRRIRKLADRRDRPLKFVGVNRKPEPPIKRLHF